jgi:hypothetical protein
MSRRTWSEFRAIAFPSAAAHDEAQRDVVYRAPRSIGLRLAFLLYLLGFTGNLVSVLRVVMSVVGVAFMIPLPSGEVLLPIIGAVLIYGQVVLDFSDGALGRLTPGGAPLLGLQFDILGCDVGRIAMAALLGCYAGSFVPILIAISAMYVLATFRVAILDIVPRSAVFDGMKWITRWLTSDQLVVVLLPFVLVIVRLLSASFLRGFAWVLVAAYAALATAWLLGMVPVRRAKETSGS